jgi:hypothetical protein
MSAARLQCPDSLPTEYWKNDGVLINGRQAPFYGVVKIIIYEPNIWAG